MEQILKALQLAKDSTYAGVMPEPAKEHLRKQLDEAMLQVKNLSLNLPVSGSLRIAAQKLLDAVGKHHPQMAMDTQLDLYMAYHEVKEALSNDR